MLFALIVMVMVRLIFFLLFTTFSLAGFAGVVDLQIQESSVLSVKNAPVLPAEDLENIWKKIGVFILNRDAEIDIRMGNYPRLMYMVWHDLVSEDRIRRLTPEVRAELKVPEKHCIKGHGCHSLVAFYLPMSHLIFVDYEKLNDDVISWVYHEIVHAYQYTYRFPRDLIDIVNAAADSKLKYNEIIDYLKFYYESQANWYTLQFTRNEKWLDSGETAFLLAPTSFLKSLLVIPTLGVMLRWSKVEFENFVPKPDQIPGHQGYFQLQQGEQLKFRELLVLRNVFQLFNIGVNFDFDFHKRFSQRIEEAYFGELAFLRQKDGGDQLIFKDLHDQYYSEIFFSVAIKMKKCDVAIDQILSGVSPLLNWLTGKIDRGDCLVRFWNLTTKPELQKSYEKIYVEGSQGRFFHAGGEGSGGPALLIEPSLFMHPQLLVDP